MNFFLFFVFVFVFSPDHIAYGPVFEELSPKNRFYVCDGTCVPHTNSDSVKLANRGATKRVLATERCTVRVGESESCECVSVVVISYERTIVWARYTKSACNWTSVYSIRLTSNGESSKSRAKKKSNRQ